MKPINGGSEKFVIRESETVIVRRTVHGLPVAKEVHRYWTGSRWTGDGRSAMTFNSQTEVDGYIKRHRLDESSQ